MRKQLYKSNINSTLKNNNKNKKTITFKEFRLEKRINICNYLNNFRGLKPGTLAQMEMNKKLRGEE